MSRSVQRSLRALVAVLVASALLSGCFGRKKNKQGDLTGSAEPDKVLYERALEDLRKSHLDVARLTLQTLINTYPDSEYLAKAKLAIADSYYKEGGTSGLTQAVAEYKDFITFFPFLDEASYAQMQVAMAHFRRMEKPDRDRTEARLAEDEFQTFLLKYPEHPLAQQAEQRLREVQEVLAEGDFRIGRYYFIKGSMRASAGRLQEVVDRYPLYSQADKALWMLGGAYERFEKTDQAAKYYSRLVREYPLSGLLDDAKQKLVKLGVPVPQPDPQALARMQREREFDRQRPGMMRRSLGLFRTGPDVSPAARMGKPNLNPPGDASSAGETITPGGNLAVGGGSASVAVQTVPPGSPGSTATAAATNTGPTPSSPSAYAPPQTNSPSAEEKTGTDAAKPSDAAKKDSKDSTDKKKEKESSSKKKKGLRKIIPW